MAVSLLGIALLNTFIGLENVSRNVAQYTKQRIANTKIDRILELLEDKDGNNMDLHKYIEKLDDEIAKLIEKETANATTSGERDLHYLFENRKHAVEWMECMNVSYASHAIAATDAPQKSYFGGM